MVTPRTWAWLEASVGVLALGVAGVFVSTPARGQRVESPGLIELTPAPRVLVPDEPPEPPLEELVARFDDDRSLPAHAEIVHRTTLRATLDTSAHSIHGEERIVWRNPSTVPATDLWLHLYLNAFKNERTAFLRERLGDGRGSRVPTDWGFIDVKSLVLVGKGAPDAELWTTAEKTSPGDPEDETDVRVPLPVPCPPGGEIELRAVFDAKLPTIVARTGYLGGFHMVGQWFPKLARRARSGRWSHFPFRRTSEFDADFGTYDVTIDAPESFVVGATGARVGEERSQGRSVTRWHAEDVHDFAFAASDDFVTRRERVGEVDVTLLAPPGYAGALERELASLRSAMGCYARRYGRYPYPTLTVIHPPLAADEAGGMEYPTLITTGGFWAGPPGFHLTEWVTVHELGHETFYGMVATDEHASPFLDEGVNSYAEIACMEELLGDASLVSAAGLRIGVAAAHREGAVEGRDDVIARAAADFPTWNAYARTVYSRTATLLRSLAGAYGTSVVDRALGRYARAYRFQHPDPRHLLSAFGDVGGDELREALRVGLYERGTIDYVAGDVASARHSTALGVFDLSGGRETRSQRKDAELWDGSALVTRRGSLSLPVEIDLLLADGTRRRTKWDGAGDFTRVAYQGSSELVGVIVDPEGKIELDERFSNNARSVAPSRYAWRVLERGAFALGVAAFLAAP